MQRQQRQRQVQTGTTTSTTTSDSESAINTASFPRTLRLRGESQSHVSTVGVGDSARTETPEHGAEEEPASRRVRWDENVVNNEGMGKKSSKVCCIYHRPRAMDESSSESDSSSSSDDSDTDDDDNMHARRRPARREGCDHDEHEHEHGHDHDHVMKKLRRKRPSPNAYERQPKNERRPTQQPKADQ